MTFIDHVQVVLNLTHMHDLPEQICKGVQCINFCNRSSFKLREHTEISWQVCFGHALLDSFLCWKSYYFFLSSEEKSDHEFLLSALIILWIVWTLVNVLWEETLKPFLLSSIVCQIYFPHLPADILPSIILWSCLQVNM